MINDFPFRREILKEEDHFCVKVNRRIQYQNQEFSVKLLDEVHPAYGGNKYFKLKYNLEQAQHAGRDTILTFGGAWSNHIYATAAACAEKGFRSIGVIRGEEPREYSNTLKFATEQGMRLVFVSREEYREKDEPFFKAWLRDELGSFYLIPEGGSNYYGVQGCTEILGAGDEKYDEIWCACGTGATLAGIILSLKPHQQAVGVSVLKGDFMRDEVMKHLRFSLGSFDVAKEYEDRFDIVDDAHFGGFAKTTPELLQLITDFRNETDIQLEQVYTAKMMWAFLQKPTPENRLAIHTGGLQGLDASLK